mgnify:CR=1 FL=1
MCCSPPRHAPVATQRSAWYATAAWRPPPEKKRPGGKESGDKEKAGELLASTNRKLDKAASKGVIHRNQAANRKSALAQAYNKI